MLFSRAIVAAGTSDVIHGPAVGRSWNADQRNDIGYMDFDHAASFLGDVKGIPLIDKQLMQLPVALNRNRYTLQQI